MKEFFNTYFSKEYWSLKNIEASPRRRFLVKQIRIFSLVIKGFSEDKVQIRASALTYYTMLSIVPIAAMAFAIAKGFGFEARLQDALIDSLEGQEQVAEWIMNFATRYLSNIKGGVIAFIGILILFWSVMRLLSNIELAFNDIWQIKKSRAISRKFSDYISLVVIAPVLIVVSIGINIFLSEQQNMTEETFPLIGYIGPILSVLLKTLPIVFVCSVFMLIYIVMPNTRVKVSSAFIAGVIAGGLFQLLNSFYITAQSSLTSYGAIYGSFAALPLFLIWLQLSWLIVLLGAEIAFANQNVMHYEEETDTYMISQHMKHIVSLLVTKQIVLNFKNGDDPMTAEDLARKLDLPIRLVRDIIYELSEVGLISETVTENVKENAYQPASDINNITVAHVFKLLDRRGTDQVNTENEDELARMVKLVDSFSQEMENSKNNKLLVDF